MTAARRTLAVASLVAVAGTTWVAGARLERTAGTEREAELLYLPNGEHLALVSLGHRNLAADAFYLWAIQYYSSYERADRYRWVEHVFDRVITELDPHFVDAYWLGALILILEAHEVDAGLRLLDKGIEHNPEQWILAYLAAWESYHAGRYEQAERYFAHAAAIPGAPASVVRMRAGMRSRTGDVGGAMRLWREIVSDPAVDERSRKVARKQLDELGIKADIERLTRAIAVFRTDNGRAPARLEELVAGGYIASVPRDPSGKAYRYDPLHGVVAPAGARVLDRR